MAVEMGDQAYAGEQLPHVLGEVMAGEQILHVSGEVTAEDPLSASNNDLTSNQQSIESVVDENLVKEEEAKEDELSALTAEEKRLWGLVKANSADFNAWTTLIQETEKTENISKIRRAYDTFLAEFPLCYGYWKKYADHEARLGVAERIGEVYEQAVRAVTYSVDIWMHYCSFAMEKFENPEEIRRLFERGLLYVETDYLSHILWDKYIAFEYNLQEWSHLIQIYTRILQIPLQQLDRYYQSFKQIASSRPLAELCSADENAELAAIVEPLLEAAQDGAEVPPGGEGAIQVEKAAGINEAEELEKFISVRETLYKRTKEWDAKIREFEAAIRRPYFHVKPLDDMQLANWHRYLDFIEKEGGFDKIVRLYERCLIACANYPEYWIRYIQKMELEGSLEVSIDALNRATSIFVKRRPEIHVFAARFKENQADFTGARLEHELLSSEVAPGLLEAIVKYANFEKRQGNLERALSIYEAAIEVEKAKEDPRVLPLLFIHYARFVDQVADNAEKARDIITSALERLPTSKVLWEAAIHFESHHFGEKQIDQLDALVEQAIAPLRPDGSQGLTPTDREEISSIFLEFLDVFGDVHAIQRAERRHRQFFPSRKGNVDSKKRASTEGSVSDRAKLQKPSSGLHSTGGPTAATPQTYTNGQAQWTGGYGTQMYQQQAQVWQQPPQQAPQLQPQQWNPGYGGQQGGYGGYGYAGYGPPQQQGPPSQQQPYGSYMPNYPQAYTQQSYVQTAPLYRPPEQQASMQQGYYQGYY